MAGSLEDLLRRMMPPMLATLTDSPPANEKSWVYEWKYDGFRAVAALRDGEVAMWSRNALDLAPRFPGVAAALKRVRIPEAVLDGEIVVLDDDGTPRFQLLQGGADSGALFYVFDILWLNGTDLRNLPLEQRRELLEALVTKASKSLGREPVLRVTEVVSGSAAAALDSARKSGWEGLIAKQRGSTYENRRSKAWLKLKAQNEQEMAIVGFTPSSHSDKEIGALILGVMENGVMTFAGKVGTGFNAQMRTDFMKRLSRDADPSARPADAPRMRDATWVKPRYVAQVRFTEWTTDNKLRHPAFLGLREDKKPEDVVRERPAAEKRSGASKTAAKAKAGRASAKRQPEEAAPAKKKPAPKSARSKAPAKPTGSVAPDIVLTNPQRLIYPRDGYTKTDVAAYYEAMSEAMITTLRDRPLSLEHWNQGIDRPAWFHQNVEKEAQPWMTLIETPTRTHGRPIKHFVADSPAALRWLAQFSALTLHMWSSRGASLEKPDWVVFDLDPAKGKGIEQAIEAALVLRKLFESMDLPSIPKTSGKRGIHLFVPIQPKYSHEETAEFAYRIAEGVSRQLDFATVERSISKRRGRLYLDAMQNGYGKTIVAPYSLRAIDGAPVSAPLKWSEVNGKLDPKKFNLRTMPDRLAKVGDLFAEVFENRVKLPTFK